MKRIALMIPLNAKGEVLLQHKSKDAPNNPNMWCLFGGATEDAESPEAAVRREAMEELGVNMDTAKFFKKTIDEEKQIERHYFSTTLSIDAETLKNQQKEGDDLGFFSLEQMKALSMNQAHLEVLNNFLT